MAINDDGLDLGPWNIKTAKALWAMIEYLHLNPVRRGLVEKALDCKWSSAAWYEQGRPSQSTRFRQRV